MAARKSAGRRAAGARDAGWQAPVSPQAVVARTGKSWQQWLAILDRENARRLGHTATAALLGSKYHLPGWWAQCVTLGYERARGLRTVHEKKQGFEIGRSRTIAASVSKVFHAWVDARTRARWLRDARLTIHRSTRNKSLRATWSDGSKSIVVGFEPRNPGRTLVSVQHGKLANAAAAQRMKAFWGARLEALRESLEKPGPATRGR